ncbi:MAG: (2Fe-2S)-binding protein [Pyrinomonadaceae bacterium]
MICCIINEKQFAVTRGTTVAAAVLLHANGIFRQSVSSMPRSALCGMGICYECSVTIDGEKHQRSCQIEVTEGMKIETDA